MLESSLSSIVVTKCACCGRRLLRSEVVSYAGCSYSAESRDLVVMITIYVSKMYVYFVKDVTS